MTLPGFDASGLFSTFVTVVSEPDGFELTSDKVDGVIIQRRKYSDLSEQFGRKYVGRRFVHFHCFTFPNSKVFAMT